MRRSAAKQIGVVQADPVHPRMLQLGAAQIGAGQIAW